MIDCYVARPVTAGFEFLVLRRSGAGRSPGAWEAVQGHLEGGETLDEFLRQFPSVRHEQAIAALELARESLLTRARPS